MQRIVEMLRLDQRGDGLERAVVHQDRTEQSLLDIDVIGDVAIGFLFHVGSCSGRSRHAKAEGESSEVT